VEWPIGRSSRPVVLVFFGVGERDDELLKDLGTDDVLLEELLELNVLKFNW
jgi:hypothetical protein